MIKMSVVSPTIEEVLLFVSPGVMSSFSFVGSRKEKMTMIHDKKNGKWFMMSVSGTPLKYRT